MADGNGFEAAADRERADGHGGDDGRRTTIAVSRPPGVAVQAFFLGTVAVVAWGALSRALRYVASGHDSALAVLSIIASIAVFLLVELLLWRLMHQKIELFLSDGVLVARRRQSLRTIMPLADVQEILLSGRRRGTPFHVVDHLVLRPLDRPWQSLSFFAQRGLVRSMGNATLIPHGQWTSGVIHADWCKRPLLELAAVLAAQVEAVRGQPPLVSVLSGWRPTPAGDLPAVGEWTSPP